jgi:hypothetical protein
LNIGGRHAVITQTGAQQGNSPGKHFVAYKRPMPDIIDQVVTPYDLILPFGKVNQHFHHLGFKV